MIDIHQTWQDLKVKAKRKKCDINASMKKTGGGSRHPEELTAIDNDILQTMCPTSWSGIEVPESNIAFVSLFCSPIHFS